MKFVRERLSIDPKQPAAHVPPVVAVEIMSYGYKSPHLDKRETPKSFLDGSTKPRKKIGSFAVGSLRPVGFDKNSELLLVISSSGRGIINCQTAEKISRDYEEYFDDEVSLEAEGIGPLAGVGI